MGNFNKKANHEKKAVSVFGYIAVQKQAKNKREGICCGNTCESWRENGGKAKKCNN